MGFNFIHIIFLVYVIDPEALTYLLIVNEFTSLKNKIYLGFFCNSFSPAALNVFVEEIIVFVALGYCQYCNFISLVPLSLQRQAGTFPYGLLQMNIPPCGFPALPVLSFSC